MREGEALRGSHCSDMPAPSSLRVRSLLLPRVSAIGAAMGHWRNSFTGANRGFSLWVLACALMLRVLVPAGWMPSTDASGVTRITLCSGEGRQTAWVDRDGTLHKQAPNTSDPRHDQPCAFAGLAFAMADAPAPTALLLPPTPRADAAPRPVPAAIGRGLPAPPPPSTGPPATV
jgi:hypothetical protein